MANIWNENFDWKNVGWKQLSGLVTRVTFPCLQQDKEDEWIEGGKIGLWFNKTKTAVLNINKISLQLVSEPVEQEVGIFLKDIVNVFHRVL